MHDLQQVLALDDAFWRMEEQETHSLMRYQNPVVLSARRQTDAP
jgi:hypothetical protein